MRGVGEEQQWVGVTLLIDTWIAELEQTQHERCCPLRELSPKVFRTDTTTFLSVQPK
jgi:hypothetical protein